jgi:hypothetical protein
VTVSLQIQRRMKELAFAGYEAGSAILGRTSVMRIAGAKASFQFTFVGECLQEKTCARKVAELSRN